MLALDHLSRAVQRDRLAMAGIIGGGGEQVQRVAGRQQGRACGLGGHGVQRLGQQLREAQAAKRRRQPARTHQPRELGAHLGPRFGRDALGDAIIGPIDQPAHDWHRPMLGKARPDPRIRIEQHIDIGPFQPQPRQRFERLARMDRLGEENAIEPARARPRDNVGQHP